MRIRCDSVIRNDPKQMSWSGTSLQEQDEARRYINTTGPAAWTPDGSNPDHDTNHDRAYSGATGPPSLRLCIHGKSSGRGGL